MDQLTSRVEVRDFNGGEAGDYYDLQGKETEPQKLHDITLYDVCISMNLTNHTTSPCIMYVSHSNRYRYVSTF